MACDGRRFSGWCVKPLDQRVAGSPVGWMYPSCQAARMHKNSTMDSPTRTASALAMWLPLLLSSRPLRIMKNKADARLAKMAMNASTTRYFMERIIL